MSETMSIYMSPLCDELDAPMAELGCHRITGTHRYEYDGIPAWAWNSDAGWAIFLDNAASVDA